MSKLKVIEHCSSCGAEEILGVPRQEGDMCPFCYTSTGNPGSPVDKALLAQMMNTLFKLLDLAQMMNTLFKLLDKGKL